MKVYITREREREITTDENIRILRIYSLTKKTKKLTDFSKMKNNGYLYQVLQNYHMTSYRKLVHRSKRVKKKNTIHDIICKLFKNSFSMLTIICKEVLDVFLDEVLLILYTDLLNCCLVFKNLPNRKD